MYIWITVSVLLWKGDLKLDLKSRYMRGFREVLLFSTPNICRHSAIHLHLVTSFDHTSECKISVFAYTTCQYLILCFYAVFSLS